MDCRAGDYWESLNVSCVEMGKFQGHYVLIIVALSRHLATMVRVTICSGNGL